MKLTTLMIATLAAATFAAALTAAPPREASARQHIVGTLAELREQLNLTDEQKTGIRGVVRSHLPDIRQQWTDGKAAREAMRTAVMNQGAESSEAQAAAEQIGEVAKNRSLLSARIIQEAKTFLTEEQLLQIEQGRADISDWIDQRLAADDL